MIHQTPSPKFSEPDAATELQAAAQWWTRLRAVDRDERAQADWLEWSASQASRLDAFERIGELADGLAALPPDAKRALAQEFLPCEHVAARGPRFAIAAAIALAALIGAAWLWTQRLTQDVQTLQYVTAIAVDRSIALADGSQVALGGASQLRTRFAPDLRQVELDAGEAFFQVAHDTQRPFIVAAGDVSIRAVGTAFNVRRTGQRVTIAVTEGRVRIASSQRESMARSSGADALEAVAGQQISYDPRASGLAVVSISPAQATQWRDHRLEFLNEPLEVVIANINRYSTRPLRLADASLNSLPFTGTVKPDALDGWLRALPKILPVRVSRDANAISIAAAEPTSR
jgi:transmembrane sensor